MTRSPSVNPHSSRRVRRYNVSVSQICFANRSVDSPTRNRRYGKTDCGQSANPRRRTRSATSMAFTRSGVRSPLSPPPRGSLRRPFSFSAQVALAHSLWNARLSTRPSAHRVLGTKNRRVLRDGSERSREVIHDCRHRLPPADSASGPCARSTEGCRSFWFQRQTKPSTRCAWHAASRSRRRHPSIARST
jgi:hypothetical protein